MKNNFNYENLCKPCNGSLHPGGIELTKYALEKCNFEINSLISDIGCGEGTTSNLLNLNGYFPIGLDSSLEMLEIARKKYPNITFTHSESHFLPFQNSYLDGIFLECVLSLCDVPIVLNECCRCLKIGGKIVISDFYDISNPSKYSEYYWKKLLQSSGFSTILLEDKTQMLKEFVLELIFNEFSLNDIKNGNTFLKEIDPKNTGYFLYIGIKS